MKKNGMDEICPICEKNKSKETCIIPRIIQRSCDKKSIKKTDYAKICSKCHSVWSNEIDSFLDKICSDNKFIRRSQKSISEFIKSLKYQAQALLYVLNPKEEQEISDINIDELRKYSIEIKYYLGHDFNISDLEIITKIRNNGKNPKLDSGFFLISLLGEQEILTKIRNKFKYFKNNFSKITKRIKDKKEKGRLHRDGTYGIETIFDIRLRCLDKRNKKSNSKYVLLDKHKIDIYSDRYELFYEKGVVCVYCGIEGKFFAKEHNLKMGWHLNLYAKDTEGKEVLMTKDHIIPKSKGGKDELENYQPMCVKCNSFKGNKMPDEIENEKRI